MDVPLAAVEKEMPDFVPSKLRFVVAMLQCLSSGLNGFILQTYVAIWWLTSDTYNVNTLQINMMSLVYAIFYIPGSMLSIYLYSKYGLTYCLIGGALLNFFSTWIRAIGAFSYNAPDTIDVYGMFDGQYAAANVTGKPYPITDAVAASNSFKVQLFGQIIAAISQPMLLNAPPRIANDWFPKGERDLAMHLMTQSNNIGGGFGSIIPAYQVFSGRSLSFMLLYQAIAGSAILAMSFFLSPFRPPIHAEYDAFYQDKLRANVNVTTVFGIFSQMLNDFGVILRDWNFVLLFLAFSFSTGVSWVFMAVVGQLIGPCGYDITIVSGALSGLGFAGVFGSLLIANVLRVWHKGFMTIQKIYFILCLGACLWCLGANQPGNAGSVVAAYIIYGFISCPLTPITLEHAAEMTYPIPADNSAALLFTGVNMVFLAITLGVQPLLAADPVSLSCSSINSNAALVILIFALIGGVIGLPMKESLKRAAITAPSSKAIDVGIELGENEDGKEGKDQLEKDHSTVF